MIQLIKQINYKQPKYMLPAIIYPFLLILGYFVIDIFKFEAKDSGFGETTEYINPSLPSPRIYGDGIGDKMTNMRNEWGNVKDFSAVTSPDEELDTEKEGYESKYTDEELAMLAQAEAEQDADMERLRLLREEMEREQAAAEAQEAARMPNATYDADAVNRRQQEELAELQAALDAAVNTFRADVTRTQEDQAAPVLTETRPTATPEQADSLAVKQLDEEAPVETVVKSKPVKNNYFNTLAENEPEPNLIKAIIDEDIKAVDGSRVRLRLLDDIELDGVVLKAGTCLFATMTGFSSQRVRGSVNSILTGDKLHKVSLTIYDSDGQEGLYVPESSFRETAKDVASGSLSGASMITSGSNYGGNNMAQWGMQALQNAITQTTSALSRNIKKNKAKLKYGTFVYLVNGR